MIWFFPTWFVNKAYEKEIEAHYIREKKRLDEKDKLENKRKALAKKQLEVIEQEEEVAKREDDLLDREQSDWQNEYEEFKASMLFEKFSWVVKAIFEHYGYIVVKDYNSNITFKVPNDILAYSQGAELIDIDIREGSIALTKKGNYFLKKYQLENQ